MKIVNNFVNYIWVGNNPIPDEFYKNFESTKEKNPDFEFKIWRDDDILNNDKEYIDLYNKSSIFHKMQIAKYTIMDSCGGIYTDFDVDWKVPFKTIYDSIDGDPNMVFVNRNVPHYYKVKRIFLIDDYFIIAKPSNTKKFLKYSKFRLDELIITTDLSYNRAYKPHEQNDPKFIDHTEPFNSYALTEWLHWHDKSNLRFLTHDQLSSNVDSTFGVHANKKTWNIL